MEHVFTVTEAQTTLDQLMPTINDLIVVRADAAELGRAVELGISSDLGGLPELKAALARFDELVSELAATQVQIKGVAPLLLDFPADFDGTAVLLCWLEGDEKLEWYHRVELGFAGRRRLHT